MIPSPSLIEPHVVQVLRCVEYRLPRRRQLTSEAMYHALALRYGLIGAAACHNLLHQARPCDEVAVFDRFGCWPVAVEKHFVATVAPRVTGYAPPNVPVAVALNAFGPVRHYFDLFRRRWSLEQALFEVAAGYLARHADSICGPWGWIGFNRALSEFEALAHESISMALMFHRRRLAGEDEIPEIALIGE